MKYVENPPHFQYVVMSCNFDKTSWYPRPKLEDQKIENYHTENDC